MAVVGVREEEIGLRVEQEKVYLSWRAFNRPFRREGVRFMGVPMVIAGLVGLILVAAGEWMLIVVVAAMAFAYWAWSAIPGEMTEYAITSRGIRVGDKLYEWWEFTRWWLTEKWEHKLLMLEAPGQMAGRLVLPLGDGAEGKRAEEIMEKLLLREAPPETAMDKAGRWLAEKFPLEKGI